MHRARVLVATLCFAVLANCGGGGGSDVTAPPPPPTLSNSITVGDNTYTPNATVVTPGATVTWTWNGVNRHDVLFDDGAHSAIQTSGTYSRQLTTAGVYNYHCSIHGLGMSGRVTVQ
jgi:plastocyanin